MNEDRVLYLAALPIILGAVFLEFWYFKKKNKAQNDIGNLSSNLLCGLIDRLFFLFFGVIQFEIMKWISNYSFFDPISNRFINGLVIFIVVDFVWYLYHRNAHKIMFFWIFHSTHHQTDDFNFSLGLRVSFLQQIIRSFFWIPIALFGFDPILIITGIFFQNFYQFFIHTDLFDFPRFSHGIMVSPKMHKLHHSNQFPHLDKNFGGVLIIWDRFFGTYASPYKQDKISLKPTNNHEVWSPFDAYFSPLIQWLGLKKEKKIFLKDESIDIKRKRLFKFFVALIIPSLVFIAFSNQMSLLTVTVSSLIFISITFLSIHFIVRLDK